MRGICRRLAQIWMGATVGALVAAGAAAAARPSYVALGDSYAAGDGTGVYYNDKGICYRSPDAYPALVAVAERYSLNFAACSGATTATVLSKQIGALTHSTALVTVQVGGNDADLVVVLEECLFQPRNCERAIGLSDAYIGSRLPGTLRSTYATIRRAAPRARVLVVGYPRLFTAVGATCAGDPLTSAQERSLNQTADLLDGTIAQEARRYRFAVVDPRDAFAGHAICSRSPYVNDLKLPAQEAFHPTISGEEAYGRLIEDSLASVDRPSRPPRTGGRRASGLRPAQPRA